MIFRKPFVHPFLFINLVLVLVPFTSTTDMISSPNSTYPPEAVNKCIDNERHALLDFKAYIYHDPYDYLSTWTHEEATNYCCNWSGVTCNNQSGHVTGLDLRFGYLEGKISPSLLNLTYLNDLGLYDNYFSGTIPVFIGSMTQLRYLDLLSNNFTGTIPVFIGSMTQLRYLDLGSNDFTGTVPSELGNLTNLKYLGLHGNSFTGTIPKFVGSMTELKNLHLGSNDFTGTVPSEFGNLTNLQELSLESLGSCTIDNLDWLSHMSKLKVLAMSGTSLGKVDNWVNVILSLKKLSALYLLGCDLSQVMHPYSYSSTNSSLSSSIETLSLTDNNLNSSMYHWLFALTGNRLFEIYLSGNNLDEIPKYFQDLCNLRYFIFTGNSMRIKFPDFLNNLSGCTSFTLQWLDASSSHLTGSLSDRIQTFSSLQYLYLSNNQLNEMSEKVWQLPKLQTLDVSSNSLEGSISEYIGATQIVTVDFSNNPLEGVHSDTHMSNLSSVTDIDLSSSKQGPHFPKWIQRLKAISSIILADTGISDTIPDEFWNMWPSQLTYLNLSSNNISGIIANLSSNFAPNTPSAIDLSSNNFYGPIPNVPSSLATLNLSKNKFSGKIFFLCQIVWSFSFLDLSHNSFTGKIPDCLWHFQELKVLNLGNNNLSGRLPASIGSLTNLEVLDLYNNSFSREFPSSLQNCTGLTFLDLGANMFSGYVPVWLGEKLSNLYALSLTSNNFLGTIPLELCQLVNLQILDLSVNNLHGTIPSCLNNLTYMVQEGYSVNQNVHDRLSDYAPQGGYVDHAMIKWQGSVRELSSTLGFVKIINLSNNNLTGKMPVELTDLHQLNALYLSMNSLLGEIPPNIGEMKELLILDLSRNNLSGRIPSSMSHMNFLNYLDVSYNNLSGRIPSGTQLQSFEPSRYTGNEGLCGPPVSKYCIGDIKPDVPSVIVESEDDLQRLFYIGGATGFSIGFWVVCIALLANNRGRHAFFHFLDSLENWAYVKVMVFIAKLRHEDP